jgi:hypothetical protein
LTKEKKAHPSLKQIPPIIITTPIIIRTTLNPSLITLSSDIILPLSGDARKLWILAKKRQNPNPAMSVPVINIANSFLGKS